MVFALTSLLFYEGDDWRLGHCIVVFGCLPYGVPGNAVHHSPVKPQAEYLPH